MRGFHKKATSCCHWLVAGAFTFTNLLSADFGVKLHNVQHLTLNAVPKPARWDLLGLLFLLVWYDSCGARSWMWKSSVSGPFAQYWLFYVVFSEEEHMRVQEHEGRVATLFHHRASTSVTTAHLCRWSCWVGCCGLLLSCSRRAVVDLFLTYLAKT